MMAVLPDSVRQMRDDRDGPLILVTTHPNGMTGDYAVMVNRSRMAEIGEPLELPAELIADYRSVHGQSDFTTGRESVLEMIRCRPCSLDDIADEPSMGRNAGIKYIEELNAEGVLPKRTSGGKLFYSATHDIEKPKQ